MTAALIDAPPDLDQYRRCAGCGRPMRPKYTKAAAHPGTVGYGTNGTCHSCTNRGVVVVVTPAMAALVEDVDWLTREGNYVDTPLNIARRVGYATLNNLVVQLRRAGAHHLVDRLYAKAHPQ